MLTRLTSVPFAVFSICYFSINDYLDNRNIIEENRPAFKQKTAYDIGQ